MKNMFFNSVLVAFVLLLLRAASSRKLRLM